MKKICIVYGFAEGRLVSVGMRKELARREYTVVTKPAEAEILLAHSGGCFMLPRTHNAKLILLVDPPMWLDKTPLWRLPEKLRLENRTIYWYKKTLFNLWYVLSRPAQWLRMGRLIKLDGINTGDARTVVVRNKEDSFAHPENVLARVSENEWSVCSMVGGHDDLWENPTPYVDIIERLYDEHGVAIG